MSRITCKTMRTDDESRGSSTDSDDGFVPVKIMHPVTEI